MYLLGFLGMSCICKAVKYCSIFGFDYNVERLVLMTQIIFLI